MANHDELEAVAGRVKAQPKIASSPQLSALFKYLWEHRAAPSKHAEIWKGAIFELCKVKDKTNPKYDYRQNVTQLCTVLRDALDEHFRKFKEGWRIELPSAPVGAGYQLSCWLRDSSLDNTHAFWKPHLDANRQVSIVYVEQLFFEDARDGLVLRYYDCNAERSQDATAELQRLHGKEGLCPVYPYVAWGELRARDSIINWFDKHALVRVFPTITREVPHDDLAWEHSLILLGATPSNRFITEALESCPDLAIALDGRTRAVLQNPTSKEKERIAPFHQERDKLCEASYPDDKCLLDFHTDAGFVPAVLSRVPNPRSNSGPVTILNSDFGSAVHQMAWAVTDEDRLKAGLEILQVPSPLPRYFQFLCGVTIRRGQRLRIHPLAWRAYTPSGI